MRMERPISGVAVLRLVLVGVTATLAWEYFRDPADWPLLTPFVAMVLACWIATYVTSARPKTSRSSPSREAFRLLTTTGVFVIIAGLIALFALVVWLPDKFM